MFSAVFTMATMASLALAGQRNVVERGILSEIGDGQIQGPVATSIAAPSIIPSSTIAHDNSTVYHVTSTLYFTTTTTITHCPTTATDCPVSSMEVMTSAWATATTTFWTTIQVSNMPAPMGYASASNGLNSSFVPAYVTASATPARYSGAGEGITSVAAVSSTVTLNEVTSVAASVIMPATSASVVYPR